MTSEQLLKIEKNKKFRRFIAAKGIWKNYAFVPPSIILFCGIFGLMYLYNENKIISYNSIFFVIIFLVGTIWFKSTRKYLIDKKLKQIKSFEICTAIHIETKKSNNKIYFFTSNNNRTSLNYLEKQKEEIIQSIENQNINISPMEPILIKNNDQFIARIGQSKEKEIPIVFINKNKIELLKKRNIMKYK